MTQKQKLNYILATLNNLYPNPEIPLFHKDSYTLLIAVLLSAQCTDKTVNKVTPVLFNLAYTPGKMFQLGQNKIQEIIRPCGLSKKKSENIWKLSQILIEKYDSKVPKDIDALELLPGVGHKTASVVMIQAFNTPAFPVDTHIHRLAYRWGISTGKNVKQTEDDLKKIFPKNIWATLHLQMIYYGREYCPARGHDLNKCPICDKLTNWQTK